jgi:hypothetical protein
LITPFGKKRAGSPAGVVVYKFNPNSGQMPENTRVLRRTKRRLTELKNLTYTLFFSKTTNTSEPRRGPAELWQGSMVFTANNGSNKVRYSAAQPPNGGPP